MTPDFDPSPMWVPKSREALLPGRVLAEQAFSRAAGAPLVAGNRVRLLKDAQENYPAWLEAIRHAEHTVYFENYIFSEDEVGFEFAGALIDKAAGGVRVRLIYDWFGGWGRTSHPFWNRLRAGGVEVRCYNPPRPESPFGWISRDHRKMLAVDGAVGFVTGLCVGRAWIGDPENGVEPWRDTGVEVRGPGVADIERAFAQVWGMTGPPIPKEERMSVPPLSPEGDTALRVVASIPNTAGMFRLDQLIAVLARQRLWLTDAYYAGTTPFVQSLAAAARDGVDVRLLVPGATDIPVLRPLSRSGYRSLLEAGIRVFEWNGSMLHAKTAVADGRWARVGSTNLNIASWLGNCELDVVVEEERFAQAMEAMYLEDLNNATEVVLDLRQKLRAPAASKRPPRRGGGSAGRAAAGALRIGNAVGAAFTNHRVLEPVERRLMFGAGLLLLIFSALSVLFPRLVVYPIGAVALWLAVSLLIRSYKMRRTGKRQEGPPKDQGDI
jgi:cardiolipin synthase A/B